VSSITTNESGSSRSEFNRSITEVGGRCIDLSISGIPRTADLIKILGANDMHTSTPFEVTT
jgi:hypothetical protein